METPKTLPHCHRLFIPFAYVEQIPGIQGVSGATAQAKGQIFNQPCAASKCALFDNESKLCGDLLQAQALKKIADLKQAESVETKISAVS